MTTPWSKPAVDLAVAELDALTTGDPESAHGEADGVLLRFVPSEVREAWQRAHDRIGFWFA